MRYILLTISMFIILITTNAYCDFDSDIVSDEKIEEPKKQPGPFRAEFSFDKVLETHFTKKGFEDQDFHFASFAAQGGSVCCFLPDCREAYFIAIGYVHSIIDWNENPFFSQDDFSNANIALRFFSNRLCDWIWQGQVQFNIDTKHDDWNHYMNIDIVLWGKYDYSSCLSLHGGFAMQTGMKIDRIYPIIGFEWDINKNWGLDLVFPVNIDIRYSFNCYWQAAVAMRFFDVRHRVGKNEPLPQALVAYRNAGVEFAIRYEWDPYIEANMHVGSTVGGQLRISNKHNEHPKHFKQDPSGYFGGEIVYKF